MTAIPGVAMSCVPYALPTLCRPLGTAVSMRGPGEKTASAACISNHDMEDQRVEPLNRWRWHAAFRRLQARRPFYRFERFTSERPRLCRGIFAAFDFEKRQGSVRLGAGSGRADKSKD